MTPERRKEYCRFGRRGEWVRCFPDRKLGLVRVQWKQKGQRIETQSYPDTREGKKEALSFAQGVWDRISAGTTGREPTLTLLELWQAFETDQFPHLRARTRKFYAENFEHWRLYLGDHFVAERATPQMVAAFRVALEGRTPRPLKVRTVRGIVGTVKTIYRWAEARELIQRNKVALYRFQIAKEKRPTSPDEYRTSEFAQILSQFNPNWSSQWRAFTAISICGTQGARQNAVLHLALPDVKLGHTMVTPDGDVRWVYGEVTWRAEWDKNGKEWRQPLRIPAQMAIEIALEWRAREDYNGPWLFFPNHASNTRPVWSQQSLWWALRAAEKRAGITHKDRRAAHGLRRMLAGEVAAATGDFLLGLRSIGDEDPRRATEYLKTRDDRVLDAFAKVDAKGGGDD
jgi:integrase